MVAVRKPVPTRMTVAEFHAWQPSEHPERRWQLVDGEPVDMAPASDDHGTIQSRACYLLTVHLDSHRPACRVVTAPGVVPRIRSITNERIPDLGVTCSPPSGSQTVVNPVGPIEIFRHRMRARHARTYGHTRQSRVWQKFSSLTVPPSRRSYCAATRTESGPVSRFQSAQAATLSFNRWGSPHLWSRFIAARACMWRRDSGGTGLGSRRGCRPRCLPRKRMRPPTPPAATGA